MTADRRPFVAHLVSSPFFGGPERQIVGLTRALAPTHRSILGTFQDNGKSRAFLDAAEGYDCETFLLDADTPKYRQMIGELARRLRTLGVDVLCAHGYKADLVGRAATWMLGIPCVAISHGYTAETRKVRLNESLDRTSLRFMDAIACVSEAQAVKIRALGIAPSRIRTIRNAIDPANYGTGTPEARRRLEAFFARPPERIVGAIGRLSPEKGFPVFVDAAARFAAAHPEIGVVVFGDGRERALMEERIAAHGLADRFILAGFATDLAALTPALDLLVLPSFTEGLPVVVLEGLASRVPVVATAVGGTPEVIGDGSCGRLVPAGDAASLAGAIVDVLGDETRRRAMGEAGRRKVEAEFTHAAQAHAYAALFDELLPSLAEQDRPALRGQRGRSRVA